MYLQYFGLRENPFSIPPDPHYLYLSRAHQEALAHLQYGLNEAGGFVQLTGEVGTGKTLLIRTLVEKLPEKIDLALVLYPVLTVSEFVAAICDELGVKHPGEQASLKQLIDVLNAHLLQTHARGRRTVLVIDEAQNLSREVLEQIRLLTNLETTKQKLLQIILIGQPELSQMLAQPDLRQLAQRITARHGLTALSHEETRDYIAHRCRVAGARKPLFTPSAMHRVHRATGGIPRLINILCDRALLGAYTRGKPVVDGRIVSRAAREVGPGVIPRRWPWQRALVMAAAFALAVVAAVWWWPETLRLSWPGNTAAIEAPPAAEPAAPAVSAAAAIVTPPAPAPAAEAPMSFEAWLVRPESRTDTETAMKDLFNRWQLDYTALAGATACERALHAGLHCVYQTGTWNNLREHNRPAVIELQDAAGGRHHVVVTALTADLVTLASGDSPREFPLAEAGRMWFGKYLLLWKPQTPVQEMLRLGDRGVDVVWLRDALARARGEPLVVGASDVFDKELQAQLMQFQAGHQLAADGMAGTETLEKLRSYLPGRSPTLTASAAGAEAR